MYAMVPVSVKKRAVLHVGAQRTNYPGHAEGAESTCGCTPFIVHNWFSHKVVQKEGNNPKRLRRGKMRSVTGSVLLVLYFIVSEE